MSATSAGPNAPGTITLPEADLAQAQRRAEERGVTLLEHVLDVLHAEAFDAWWKTLTPEEQAQYEADERAIERARASGPGIVADAAFWEEERRRLQERRDARAAGHRPT